MLSSLRKAAGDMKSKIRASTFRQTAYKPRFVIIGTGRSGTNYIANRLSSEGIECLHERFFATDGPNFDAHDLQTDARGESSWLAVPFLPLADIPLAHVTRHPFGVIKSFHNIGFFHAKKYGNQIKFIRFAKQHFTFSDDPLRSAMRWYIEWNSRCRSLTSNHIRVEEIDERIDELRGYLGLTGAPSATEQSAVAKSTNSRSAKVADPVSDVQARLQQFPEYPQLCELAAELGYDLSGR